MVYLTTFLRQEKFELLLLGVFIGICLISTKLFFKIIV